MRLSDLHPKRFFLETWRQIDAEATEYRSENSDAHGSDVVLAGFVLSLVAVSLVLQGTLGERDVFVRIIDFIDDPFSPESHPLLYFFVGWLKPNNSTLEGYLSSKGYYQLALLCYWAAWRVFGFLILPLLAVAFYPRLRRMPLGLTFKGMRRHLWVYGLFLIIVLVPVFIVSFFEEFTAYYPFYRKAHRSLFDFVVWEAFYVAQFFSLEFFFRGFMLHPLRRFMGSSAIFAMMIPYVMIHIGKPLVECLAAVLAGIILGTLAFRTRSIWGGFFIHVGVALAMDILVIWHLHW